MKIYMDADGCPVISIAVNVAKEYSLEIIIIRILPMKFMILMQVLYQ